MVTINLRNDETIISSISVTDIVFDVYYSGSAEGHEYPDLYRLSDNYR